MYDFSKVDAPKEINYLTPGIFVLHPSAVELEQPDGKSPFLNITFAGNEGIVKQKFYLTTKALPNLQYLHEGLFGKGITKAFDSNEQAHAYFEKVLTTKVVEKPFLVGGEEAENGKVYCNLPFGRFMIKEGTPYEVGAFEPGTARYKDVIKRSERTSRSEDLATNSSLLPNSGDNEPIGDDDLPW